MLIVNLLISTAILVTVFVIILPRRHQGFKFYSVPTDGSTSRDEILRWIHGALFNILPTIALTGLTFWWGKVENLFRVTQPYVGLASALPGKDSALLDYNFDFPFAISVKALQNKHWRLAYVTSITLLVTFATVLAGGIFIETAIPTINPNDLIYPLLQQWPTRNFSTFGGDGNVEYDTIANALVQGSGSQNWISGPWLFAEVDLPYDQNYVALSGIKANLSCESVSAKYTSTNGSVEGQVELLDGACAGNLWEGYCALNGEDEGATDPGFYSEYNLSNITCTSWVYLKPDGCSNTTNDGTGRYWFYATEYAITGVNQTELVSSTSLVCKAFFYNETVLSFVDKTNSSLFRNISITPATVVSSEAVGPNAFWTNVTEGARNLDFYWGDHLNDGIVNQVHQIGINNFMDYFTIMMGFNNTSASQSAPGNLSSSATTSNTANIVQAASDVFSASFALQFTQPKYQTFGPPVFFEDINMTIGGLATYGSQLVSTEMIWPFALYCATAIIAVYSLSVFLFFFNRGDRRTPKKVGVIANEVSMIYDSSLVKLGEQSLASDQLKSLEGRRFGLGVFVGASGKRRLGIETVEKVEVVERNSWWKIMFGTKEGRKVDRASRKQQ